MTDPVPAGGLRHSVVVPTYQRRDLVTATVEALMRQDRLPLEVVVIVDGSTDGTAEALRALRPPFPMQVVEQPNAGLSRGRNRGASMVSGDLILFLDDDMVSSPDMLTEFARVHAQGADAAVGHIPVLPASLTGFLARGLEEWAVGRRQRILDNGGRLTRGDLLGGQLSVRRDVFESLGGFDEQFTRDGSFGGEDTDFGRRLLDGGHRVVFAADAVAHQHYAVPPRSYLRQWHEAGSADVAYLRKFPDDIREVYEAKRPHSRSNRLVVRPVARVPLVRDVAAAALRQVALAAVAVRPDDDRASRLFFKARNLEYWRGVASAGGLPRVRPVRVLCYHAVSDLAGAPRLEPYGVPAALLRRQLRLLRRVGFRFVTLDEVLRVVDGNPGVPRRAMLVTFDDCYDDLVSAGLEVLEAERVPASAYAVADRVGGTNTWDVAIGAPELPLLDVDGLHLLQSAGIEVGVHGSTHVPLTRVSDDPRHLDRETAGATTTLAGLGLRPLRTFAYPHGEHDARVRAAVADAGLEAAFTVTPGRVRAGGDRYQLPRIEVLRADGAGVRLLLKVLTAGWLPRPTRRRRPRQVRRWAGRVGRRLRSHRPHPEPDAALQPAQPHAGPTHEEQEPRPAPHRSDQLDG